MGQQPTFYRAGDASLEPLHGRVVGVIGYGNLGRSVALNLRDSGVSVVVGNVDDDARRVAEQDGFAAVNIPAAAADADLVYVLVPDDVLAQVFTEQIRAHLKSGAALCVASGYVLAYGHLDLPPDVDVLLLAPRMVGDEVRACYVEERGFLSYVSVEHDATGRAIDRVLALALAVGSLHRGAMRLSAEQEATLDLFVEQSVGPYFGAAVQTAFAVGVEAGLPAEALVCELYMSGEMERVLRSMAVDGFLESVRGHGLVAAYGGFMATIDMDTEAMQRHFRTVLDNIRSGEFARRLQAEQADGYPTWQLIEELIAGDDPLTAAERRVRKELA